MPSRSNAKHCKVHLPKTETGDYLSQLFGKYFDFEKCVYHHPLFNYFLFGTETIEDSTELLQEIRWVLKRLEKSDNSLVEDFLIELSGLKITIENYQITTWVEAKSILEAEKKAFHSILLELLKKN